MLLNQLFEAITRTGKGDTAVVGWGRGMGHKGHMMLASSVITKAKEMGGDPYFVVSKTVGKDDPITPDEKLAIYKKVFPQSGHIFQPATDEIPDLTRVLQNLNQQGYTSVTVVLGADQVKAFQYLKNYNNKPDKSGNILYSFDNLDVISRQETGDPSAGEEGPRATPMRQVLQDPAKSDEEQFQVWRDAMSPEVSDDEVRDLMTKAKTRMAGFAKPKKESVAEGLTTEKQILTRIRQIMYDRKLSGTESNAGELLRLKQQLKDLRSQQGVAERMLPKSAFAGSDKHKLGSAAHAKGKQKGPVKRGQFVGGMEEGALSEKINPKTLAKGFVQEKDLGWYTLQAVGDFASRMANEPPTMEIYAMLKPEAGKRQGTQIGQLSLKIAQGMFLKDNPGAEALVAGGVDVDPAYQRKGVASAMYAFAKELGNDVIASVDQSDDAKAMWAGMRAKGVAEGFVFLSPKEKGNIQNIVSQLSDIPGMWDHAAQTFTDAGIGRLKAALKDNSKYIKYAVNLTADDFDEDIDEAKQRLDPKCWTGYRKQGTKMKGGVRVNNCVKVGEGWEQVMSDAISKLFEGKK